MGVVRWWRGGEERRRKVAVVIKEKITIEATLKLKGYTSRRDEVLPVKISRRQGIEDKIVDDV